jgi:murein DD-endopeptidase MepM/ murein hydrolase activator NlpD
MAVFPLPMRPQQNYHRGGIAFRGRSKSRGDRIHAACDLVVPAGTPVYAVEGGVVLKVPKKSFHLGTYTITVQHGTFQVRYCELAEKRMFKEGETVLEGDKLGTVGRNSNGGAMLHFEMYRGSVAGYFSQPWNSTKYLYVPPGNFQRRKDLLDPTPHLDRWQIITDWSGYVCEDPPWSE